MDPGYGKGCKGAARRGELLFGTVDTCFLISISSSSSQIFWMRRWTARSASRPRLWAPLIWAGLAVGLLGEHRKRAGELGFSEGILPGDGGRQEEGAAGGMEKGGGAFHGMGKMS